MKRFQLNSLFVLFLVLLMATRRRFLTIDHRKWGGSFLPHDGSNFRPIGSTIPPVERGRSLFDREFDSSRRKGSKFCPIGSSIPRVERGGEFCPIGSTFRPIGRGANLSYSDGEEMGLPF